MLSSRFAGIPISSSTIDGPGVPQLLNRGEQTMRAVTGSGGRLHFGMVAGIKSERWPTSNRNPWPDCVGIRKLRAATSKARLLRDQCRHTEAQDLLAPVYSWFTEGFDTLDLKEAKTLLDE